MVRAEHVFTLPVDPSAAFDWLSDPARDPEWQASCVSTNLHDDTARVGGLYDITFRMVGRSMTFTVRLVAFEPGVRSVFTVEDGPFVYTGSYTYTALPDGATEVHWTFDVDPGDYFGIMPISLLRKVLLSAVKKDTAKLAQRLRAA